MTERDREQPAVAFARREPTERVGRQTRTLLAPSIASKEVHMIGTIVTFQYDSDFDSAKLRKIAETARTRFEKMPGLRSKAFTVDANARQAVNVYVWDSEDAA